MACTFFPTIHSSRALWVTKTNKEGKGQKIGWPPKDSISQRTIYICLATFSESDFAPFLGDKRTDFSQEILFQIDCFNLHDLRKQYQFEDGRAKSRNPLRKYVIRSTSCALILSSAPTSMGSMGSWEPNYF